MKRGRVFVQSILVILCCFLTGYSKLSAQNMQVSLEAQSIAVCDCLGGISATVTGGSGFYTYLWSDSSSTNSIDNLCSGNYSLTVIDTIQYDTVFSTFLLTDSCLTLSTSVNDSVTSWACNGVATAIVSGGLEPYTYYWSTGETDQTIDNLCPGDYCVTVSDDSNHYTMQCFTIDEFIDTSCVADFEWLPAGSPQCYETCYEFIDNSIGSGYSMVWSFGDSVFATSANPDFAFTSYGERIVCLTIQTASCIDTACLSIYVDSCHIQIDTIITAIDEYNSCTGGIELQISEATAPYSMVWSTGSTNAGMTGLCSGIYCATVTDAFACKDSICIELPNPPDTACSADFSVARQGLSQFNFSGDSGIGDVISWHWEFGDQSYSNIQSPTHIYTSLGLYTVCLNIETSSGCFDTVCEDIHIDTCDMSASANVQHVSCYNSCDGQVMMLSSGNPPYTYSWQSPDSVSALNIFSDLCEGVYNVTVTDADYCTLSSVIEVDSPDSLALSGTVSQISCFNNCDGSLNLTATGGVPPFTYYLTDSLSTIPNPITGLCPGEYNVLITDYNQCSDTGTFVIHEAPAELDIYELDFEDVACYNGCDGSAQAFVSGGSVPYTYLWNNGSTSSVINNLCYSQYGYQVTVTDENGCTKTDGVTINQPAPIIVGLTATNASCHQLCNGSIDAEIITGGTYPFSFVWSNGSGSTTIQNLCPGTYYTTVTDGNLCTGTAYTIVNEPDSLIAAISNLQDLSCYGLCEGSASVGAVGGVQPYSVLWSQGSSSVSIDSLCAGTYVVTVTDAQACTSIASDTIYQPDLLEINIVGQNETGYNLCDGLAYVEISGGTEPYDYLWSQDGQDATIEELCIGSYFLTVTDTNNCMDFDSVYINTPPSYSLSGRVFAGINLLPEGMAILYKKNAVESFNAISRTSIVNGSYSFEYLQAGTYMVHAVPHFDVLLQTPVYMPTYYGNRVFWTQSDEILISEDASLMDIFLAKNETVLYGDASVTGNVSFSDSAYYESSIYNQDWFGDISGGKKDLSSAPPARNITVLILDQDHVPLTYTLTDSMGNFSVEYLPFQLYKIYPEKAGYITHPITESFSDQSTILTDADFRIDYKNISNLLNSIAEESFISEIKVYPNPFDKELLMKFSLDQAAEVSIDICNSLGVKIAGSEEYKSSGQHIIKLETDHLSKGIYFATILLDNNKLGVCKIIKL